MSLEEVVKRFRLVALRRSTRAMRDVLSVFNDVLRAAQAEASRFAQEIDPQDLASALQYNRLQNLIREIEQLIRDASQRSAEIVSRTSDELDRLGRAQATEIASSFSILNVASIAVATHATSAEGRVGQLFRRLAPLGAERARSTIIRAVALGLGVERTARELSDALAITRARALTIARTETLNAYREGARLRYMELGLRRYRWLATGDERTCAICADLNGQVFDIEAPMNPHPNCRCTILPVLEK
jgi:SPP1 gp7 family putative phage head morphogenesis protein